MKNQSKMTLYAVMKLSSTVEIDYFGQTHHVKVAGARGFIPVFETIEEAIKQAQNGKYQIMEINIIISLDS